MRDDPGAAPYLGGMSEALFPTRWKKDKPPSTERFMATFAEAVAGRLRLPALRFGEGMAA